MRWAVMISAILTQDVFGPTDMIDAPFCFSTAATVMGVHPS